MLSSKHDTLEKYRVLPFLLIYFDIVNPILDEQLYLAPPDNATISFMSIVSI